jgi:nitrogen fixation/metabolism regulation signal transduction histidine kinase
MQRILGIIVVGLSILAAATSYLFVTGRIPAPHDRILWVAVGANLLLVAIILAIVATQWRTVKDDLGRGVSGRTAWSFAIGAMVPAFLLAAIASDSNSRLLDRWLQSENAAVGAASNELVYEYLDSQRKIIRAEIASLTGAVSDATVGGSDDSLRTKLADATGQFLAAYLVDAKGSVRVEARHAERVAFVAPTMEIISSAASGNIPVFSPLGPNSIAALGKLQGSDDAYLYLVRELSPRVTSAMYRIDGARIDQSLQRGHAAALKLLNAVVYFTIALTAFSAVAALGLFLASRSTKPVSTA